MGSEIILPLGSLIFSLREPNRLSWTAGHSLIRPMIYPVFPTGYSGLKPRSSWGFWGTRWRSGFFKSFFLRLFLYFFLEDSCAFIKKKAWYWYISFVHMHTVGLLCKMFFKAECTLHWVSPYEIWLLSAIYSQLLNRKTYFVYYHTAM